MLYVFRELCVKVRSRLESRGRFTRTETRRSGLRDYKRGLQIVFYLGERFERYTTCACITVNKRGS